MCVKWKSSKQARDAFKGMEIQKLCVTCISFDKCSHKVSEQFAKMVTHDMGIK
jgi:hypothetical protein